MSLTYGTGPFGDTPAGRFNLDIPREQIRYVEDLPRWIRARLGGETVVDSRRPRFVHEHTRLPRYLFPAEDVRLDLIPGDAVTRHPDGLVEVDFKAMDEWLEEDEPLIGHPRDPYHRIDVRRTSRHVRVSVDGQVVADTRRARALFEAGHPTRWYIPAEDVRSDLLEESEKTSVCAYKGVASYWSVGPERDVVWTYREPLGDAMVVRDYLCFFNERVDIEIDGEPEARPHTQWSPG